MTAGRKHPGTLAREGAEAHGDEQAGQGAAQEAKRGGKERREYGGHLNRRIQDRRCGLFPVKRAQESLAVGSQVGGQD